MSTDLIERLRAVIETATSDSMSVEHDRVITKAEHDSCQAERDEAEAVRDLIIERLTPTDDDREALMSALDPASRRTAVASRAADRVTAAGFHRSVTPTNDERADAEQRWPIPLNYEAGDPEHTLLIAQRQAYMLGRSDARTRSEVPEPPTPEAWRDSIVDERCQQPSKGYTSDHDHEHGLDHLLEWAQEYARIGEPLKSAALVEAARDLHRATPKPQGEPSDAQVLAALDAFFQGRSTSLSEFGSVSVAGMRAALRAAGGVR